jgi:hypothetical protein
MMLAIAIILGVAMILNIVDTKGNYNTLMAAALVVSVWSLNWIVGVVILSLLVVIGIGYFIENN